LQELLSLNLVRQAVLLAGQPQEAQQLLCMGLNRLLVVLVGLAVPPHLRLAVMQVAQVAARLCLLESPQSHTRHRLT
jgi:hypothetical protein